MATLDDKHLLRLPPGEILIAIMYEVNIHITRLG